jgi:thiol-disulfide isomerase/thioredoxin
MDIAPGTLEDVVTVDGRDLHCQVFSSPQGADGDLRRYWFDPQSCLIVRAEIVTHGQRNGVELKQEMNVQLTGFALDEEVDEALFRFTPPEGIQVVDNLAKLGDPNTMVGETAPDIEFKDMDGQTFALSDLRGKVVFLDFWATWCNPCRMEMPHIETLHKELGPGGEVVFIGASSEDKATIERFLAKTPYTFRIAMVSKEDAALKYKVSSIPAGFVIDRDGVIRAQMIGARNEIELRQALAKAGIGD